MVIAAAALAARLPFLLRADRFFDADEAVEGLMAKHLGDHSLFLWGQRYKGTPEVLLTGTLFRVTGPGVIALKAVTLACFVIFLCLNIRLIERVFSRRIAWLATALFIVGPPSLVLWTLSGSAEIVMTLVAGTVLLLAVESSSYLVAAAAFGAGLWIHQYIVYYVAAVALALIIFYRPTFESDRRSPRWMRAMLAVLGAVVALYTTLGLIAFFTSGLDVHVAGVRITATHPQKMWWIAGAVFAGSLVLAAVATLRRQLLAPAIAFLIGYSPAIIGRIGNHGLGAPISRLDFSGLRAAMPDIAGIMLPILLGFRDPTGARTTYGPLVLVLVCVAAWSYWVISRRSNSVRTSRIALVFHVLPLVAIVAFFASGSYIDAQSYRYLMPIYAALPVIYAVGIDSLWKTARPAGAALLLLMLGLFGLQQLAWYQHLQPDETRARTIACLQSKDIRAARAPYWSSYPVTFLTDERIIVSPTDGIDRYPSYSATTRGAQTIQQLCP